MVAPFVTGGHLYGGIESTLRELIAHFSIFAMRVVPGEKAFQPMFPFGVGATTGARGPSDTAHTAERTLKYQSNDLKHDETPLKIPSKAAQPKRFSD